MTDLPLLKPLQFDEATWQDDLPWSGSARAVLQPGEYPVGRMGPAWAGATNNDR